GGSLQTIETGSLFMIGVSGPLSSKKLCQNLDFALFFSEFRRFWQSFLHDLGGIDTTEGSEDYEVLPRLDIDDQVGDPIAVEVAHLDDRLPVEHELLQGLPVVEHLQEEPTPLSTQHRRQSRHLRRGHGLHRRTGGEEDVAVVGGG